MHNTGFLCYAFGLALSTPYNTNMVSDVIPGSE